MLFRDRATEPSRSQHQPQSHARNHDRRSRETHGEHQATPRHVDDYWRRGRNETSSRYLPPGNFRWRTRTPSQPDDRQKGIETIEWLYSGLYAASIADRPASAMYTVGTATKRQRKFLSRLSGCSMKRQYGHARQVIVFSIAKMQCAASFGMFNCVLKHLWRFYTIRASQEIMQEAGKTFQRSHKYCA